jgi:phage terminase large subunit-like protein
MGSSENQQSDLLTGYESVAPYVIGNPFIPHWPTPAQWLFLGLHKTATTSPFEALYGGAAGGGKSDALLMAAAQYAWQHPDFSAILFRRTHTDLAQPGALMDRALQWWLPQGVRWDGTNKIAHFPSGAKVAFAYLKNPNDHLRYQGAEYQLTGWDELTQWPTAAPYEYVGLSRVRRKTGSHIPLRTLSASNPGGPGHVWVKARFVGGVDPETGRLVDPQHPYIPARIADNPHLDRDAYIAGLLHMHPTVREQLLNGDWEAREPGDYFRREWFGPLLDPEADKWESDACLKIRWWDLAASEKPEAARTAGVLMARHVRGVRAVVHARAFQATPGKRDDLIVQQAQIDGHTVTVGIEIEGGSGGPAQFYALEKRLRSLGYRVVGARPKAELTDAEGKVLIRNPVAETGKEARADPVASCLERGHQRRGECSDTGGPWWGVDRNKHPSEHADGIRLFAGPWTQDYLDELEGFPEAERKDFVDATSGAWAWLEAHPPGAATPPRVHKPHPPAELQNVHPSERPDPRDAGKDRSGHWRP